MHRAGRARGPSRELARGTGARDGSAARRTSDSTAPPPPPSPTLPLPHRGPFTSVTSAKGFRDARSPRDVRRSHPAGLAPRRASSRCATEKVFPESRSGRRGDLSRRSLGEGGCIEPSASALPSYGAICLKLATACRQVEPNRIAPKLLRRRRRARGPSRELARGTGARDGSAARRTSDSTAPPPPPSPSLPLPHRGDFASVARALRVRGDRRVRRSRAGRCAAATHVARWIPFGESFRRCDGPRIAASRVFRSTN